MNASGVCRVKAERVMWETDYGFNSAVMQTFNYLLGSQSVAPA